MKLSDLKSAVRECILEVLNEDVETQISDKLDKLMRVSPGLKDNLKKLRAEPQGAGSTWALVLYDKRGNKAVLAGGLAEKPAKEMLHKVKDLIFSKLGVSKDGDKSTDTSFFMK